MNTDEHGSMLGQAGIPSSSVLSVFICGRRVHLWSACSSVVGFFFRLGSPDVDRQELLRVDELPRCGDSRAFFRDRYGAGAPQVLARDDHSGVMLGDELLMVRNPLAQEVNRSRRAG